MLLRFRYGRTALIISGDQVHLTLTYCPKRETVEKKLKGLPVKWIRVFVDTEEEFKLLCKGIQKFKEVNLNIDDDDASNNNSSGLPPPPVVKKRKINVMQNIQVQQPLTTRDEKILDLPSLDDEELNFEGV